LGLLGVSALDASQVDSFLDYCDLELAGGHVSKEVLNFIERCLLANTYIASTPCPTIADIALACELAHVRASLTLGLNTDRWLRTMVSLMGSVLPTATLSLFDLSEAKAPCLQEEGGDKYYPTYSKAVGGR
jgi:hypothetical protein